ncbi:transcriptional regulator [Ventosimonas gracilis]|uniref:Transcriptional regulator n=1 Tax=Ventosimonas gracilis TaxID=1680762 RepID=A0A139SRL4_9GAMM|nr:FMN-binding negative transcriptional regulator [Ventosimonas gracilis]KXU37198.1 transcriptional regulator [Ventosimonas gracilis]
MYVPEHFSETRLEALHALILRHPFAILCTCGKNGLDANHIPFELEASVGELGRLHGHLARQNPLVQELADGGEVLVVFRAEHAYISPQWYPSKHEFHKQVPTWNFQVVHAHGRARLRDDKNYLLRVVGRLTKTHEAAQSLPWKMSDSSREFIDALLAQIVGIEIEITRLIGKSKLSQNKEVRDIKGAAQVLQRQGHLELAEAMRQAAEEKAGS